MFFTSEQLGGLRKKIVLRDLPPIPATNWRPPDVLPDLRNASLLAFDVETWEPDFDHGPGWSRGKGHIVGISLAAMAASGERWSGYFPFKHTVQPEGNLPASSVLPWVSAMLETPYLPKTGANLIYDVGWLSTEGINVQGKLYDVQFAEILLHERNKVALNILGKKYCNSGKDTDILYEWSAKAYGGAPTGEQRANIYRCPPCLVGPYAEMDAVLPIDILAKQMQRLKIDGLIDLFEMECALIPLLVQMRLAGITVDLTEAECQRDVLATEITSLYGKLKTDHGFTGSVDSSIDLAKLFDTVGIKYGRTEAGNPSFRKDFLKTIENPVAKLINKIRELSKLKSTFLEGYILEGNVNGKIHCNFHPLRNDNNGAITGRMASSEPNLQNIPSRTDAGKRIRKCFVKDVNHAAIMKCDYSQIEYRMLAHFAVGPGSDALRQSYIDNPATDYHDITQRNVKLITGIEIDRKPIKNINFGLLYGSGETNLAQTAGFDKKQAKAMFAAYHKGAPYVKATMEAISNEAQQNGIITTILGRRTHFDLWESINYGPKDTPLPHKTAYSKWGNDIKRAGCYKAVNYKLQGSATGDLLKTAILALYNSGVFSVTGVPRLTVHDELDWSLPTGIDDPAMREAIRYTKHVMQTALPLRVPVLVDPEIGTNWGNVAQVVLR